MTPVLFNIYGSIAVVYTAFILFCWIGWRRIALQRAIRYNPAISVSIIIPARNEEQNILNCLEDLAEQEYPAAMFEVIVVDDHSTDSTSELVNEFITVNVDKSFRLICLNEEGRDARFKKFAITKGVEQARGQLIITSDADCRFSPGWISSIVQHYEITKASMIAGPVRLVCNNTILEKLQALEFMGLIGIGAGSMRNSFYIMCNGANLAYSKNVFNDVNGFDAGRNTASGDDTQLMMKIAMKGDKIHFLKSKNAIVNTSSKNTMHELIQQRKRWASKIPHHTSLPTVLIAASAYLLHAGILLTAGWMIVHQWFSWMLLMPLFMKCAAEFIVLLDTASFFDRKKLLWLFLPAQVIYPFYIVIVGTIAPFGTYLWKERKVK